MRASHEHVLSEEQNAAFAEAFFCMFDIGVANLMLDILAQMQCGGSGGPEGAGAASLLLVGPPGVGESAKPMLSCSASSAYFHDCCTIH